MYWAKPGQTYDDHITKCYEVWQTIWRESEHNFRQLSDRLSIPFPALRKKSLLSVLFHDIGKLIEIFQENMELIAANKNPDWRRNFRHEVISACFLLDIWIEEKLHMEVTHPPYEAWAVLGHHRELEPNWRNFDRERRIQGSWPVINKERVNYAIKIVDDILEQENVKIGFPTEVNGPKWQQRLFKYMDVETSVIKKEQDRESIPPQIKRQIYSVLKGILHYCDWTASTDTQEYRFTIMQGSNEIEDRIKQKVADEGKNFEQRPFQKAVRECHGDLLAIAPTGSGKTEAAILWALNQDFRRLILLMPTMITSNALYSRISQKYFSPGICGLAHSGAQTYFSIHDNDTSEARFKMLHNKGFIPPVMVATVDQLLSSGFNTGLWTLKELSLIGSSVIFDEIQAYDTYTLGLITEIIKRIKTLGGRVMLMSATMPKALRDHFLSVLPDTAKLIIAQERMGIARNNWRYLDKPLNEIDEELQHYLTLGKRVAIIVNDIESAKRLYSKWTGEYKTICYHSEFTMRDRLEKEAIIDDCKLLISTQAVEVSLDIDFDVMFSECAPLDSLIQRAGRCNRNGFKQGSEFIVFQASDIAKNKVYKKWAKILERTEETIKSNQKYLSEYEIMDMLEHVYSDFTIYDDNFKRAQEIYDMVAREEMIFDVPLSEEKTRILDYEKVSIIPIKFKDIVEDLFAQRRYALIPLYEVPIGITKYHKLRKHRYDDNRFNLPIFYADYSCETGINWEEISTGFSFL